MRIRRGGRTPGSGPTDEWASAQALLQKRPSSGDCWRSRGSTAARVVLNARAPILDAAGEVVGAAVAIQDVTDLRKAQEALRRSEALYRAIGESMDYGVWVCAPDGRNTYASESFLTMVGLTQQECADFGWGAVLHPDDADRTIAAWKECVRTGGIWDIEHRFRGVDGQWHDVLARGVPVKDERGEVLCWAGINLDISRLKRAEAALRQLNVDLEQRVAARTADLSQAIQTLERQATQLRALATDLTRAEQRERRRLADVLHDGLQQQLVAARLRAHMLARSSAAAVQAGADELVTLLEEAIAQAAALRPDVIFLDMRMPRADGPTATRRILETSPDAKIVMLTVSGDEDSVVDAVQRGAHGYLLKTIDPPALFDALRGVVRGEAALASGVATTIMRAFTRAGLRSAVGTPSRAELNAREREIVTLVAGGEKQQGDRHAARSGGDTVKNHLKNILATLHLENRVQVAVFVLNEHRVFRSPENWSGRPPSDTKKRC